MEEDNVVQRNFEVKFATLAEHEYPFFEGSSLKDDPTTTNCFVKLSLSCCGAEDAYKKEELDEDLDFYNSDGETSVSADSDSSSTGLSVDSPLVVENVNGDEEESNLSSLLGGVEVHELRRFAASSSISSISDFIYSRIVDGHEPGSFLTTNLATVVAQLKQWRRELPMVEPFYAVKCNPDPVIVRLLASMGCSFDCATQGEIDLVANGLGEFSFSATEGKTSSSIVYANPAKMTSMLSFAIDTGVKMTVFDGEDELIKIAETPGHEKLQLLLRLTTDDKASVCRFSKKFGCPVSEAPALLDVAKELGLNVAGVSFHVGSGCGDAEAYATALEHARIVFEEGEKRGMPPMSIIDIGGGFPGDTSGYGGAGMPTFQQLAATIRISIDKFLIDLGRSTDEIRFIAEPGRYFVSASTVITTKIYSRKGGKGKYQALYVDDGVYGSFNNVVYDHALPVPKRLISVVRGGSEEGEEEALPTAVFGPTCDGLDQMCSLESTLLPRCEVGEWLIWEDQGAYTHTASFVFNGYTHIPKKTYVYY